MQESKLALKFGLGAGFLGVLCCVGPLIPILIGFGSASALFGLDRYKPVFIGVGILVLAGASWYAIRKRNQCCTTKNRLKDVQTVVLIFGVGFASYFTLQYGVVPLVSNIASAKVANQQKQPVDLATYSELALSIEGMTCAGCSVGVQQALLEVPGVLSATVSFETGLGSVTYDRNQVSPEDILKAKVQDQYTLKIDNEHSIADEGEG